MVDDLRPYVQHFSQSLLELLCFGYPRLALHCSPQVEPELGQEEISIRLELLKVVGLEVVLHSLFELFARDGREHDGKGIQFIEDECGD